MACQACPGWMGYDGKSKGESRDLYNKRRFGGTTMGTLTELKASGIFVDLENMAVAGERQGVRFDLSRIMTRVGEISIPILRKAYGDWGRFATYQEDFVDRAFDLVQLFSTPPGKNGLDIQMSVDAVEAIILWPRIDIVFLITGDSDYCPLVRMLRKHGRQVIGIGWQHCTGKTFQEHCDEFWPYDELVGLSVVQKLRNCEGLQRLFSQVSAELEPDQWVDIGTFKKIMLRYDPSFNEKQYGFAKLSEFATAHPDLQVKSPDGSSGYLVQLPSSKCVERNGKH